MKNLFFLFLALLVGFSACTPEVIEDPLKESNRLKTIDLINDLSFHDDFLKFKSEKHYVKFIQNYETDKEGLLTIINSTVENFTSYSDAISILEESDNTSNLTVLQEILHLIRFENDQITSQEDQVILPLFHSKAMQQTFNENAAIGIGDEVVILTDNYSYKLSVNQYETYKEDKIITSYLEKELIERNELVEDENQATERVTLAECTGTRVRGRLKTNFYPIVNIMNLVARTQRRNTSGRKTLSHTGPVNFTENGGLTGSDTFSVRIDDSCTRCRNLSTVLKTCGVPWQCISYTINSTSTNYRNQTNNSSCNINI